MDAEGRKPKEKQIEQKKKWRRKMTRDLQRQVEKVFVMKRTEKKITCCRCTEVYRGAKKDTEKGEKKHKRRRNLLLYHVSRK